MPKVADASHCDGAQTSKAVNDPINTLVVVLALAALCASAILGELVRRLRAAQRSSEGDAAARRSSEAQMRHLTRASADGLAIFDANDRLVVANAAYREFSGPVGGMFTPGMSIAEIVALDREAGASGERPGR